jgi:transposase
MRWAQESYHRGIKEISKVVNMFDNHMRVVVSALLQSFSKAMAERLNGKIQEIKLMARGYRQFQNFRSAILFFHGGLNLYPLK